MFKMSQWLRALILFFAASPSFSPAFAGVPLALVGAAGMRTVRVDEGSFKSLEGYDTSARVEGFLGKYSGIELIAGAGLSYLYVDAERERAGLTVSRSLSGFAGTFELGGQYTFAEHFDLLGTVCYERGFYRTSILRAKGKVHGVSVDSGEIEDLESMNHWSLAAGGRLPVTPELKVGIEFLYNAFGSYAVDDDTVGLSGTAWRLLVAYQLQSK